MKYTKETFNIEIEMLQGIDKIDEYDRGYLKALNNYRNLILTNEIK